MPFVSRDRTGRISGVFDKPTPQASEQVHPSSPELAAYQKGRGVQNVRGRLGQSDTEMARITEDLIDVLIGRNIINFTDFPNQAQQKLIARRNLRSNLSSLTNLVTDQDDIL
jgi:hypothetical protein